MWYLLFAVTYIIHMLVRSFVLTIFAQATLCGACAMPTLKLIADLRAVAPPDLNAALSKCERVAHAKVDAMCEVAVEHGVVA